MAKNFVEELRWRGMLAQIMPGTEEYLNTHMVSAYLGTDPTADSLHIGHLCGIMMLRHLQRCGHKPYLLVGGATGMIGDPSGKSQERNLLDSDTLYHNQEAIKKQVAKFLDFDGNEPNKAELVNNYDWMKDFTFLDFAREVGKHITVNYMMAKDSVQKRLNGEARDGLSFTEFTYQLLQGYDFLYQYQKYGIRLQLGGNDQMLVQVSYAIGVAEPVNIYVNTYGRSNVKMSDGEIAQKISKLFDLRPKAIERTLKLRQPIYRETAAYGHMGRKNEVVKKTFTSRYHETKVMEVELFTWEKLDRVDDIKKEFGL